MSLAQRLLEEIREWGSELIRPGDLIVIGVSGGSDSMALLHLLYEIRHDLGIQLHVVHYNHRWRDSADADEQFVRNEAQRLGVPLTVGRARSRVSKADKGSLEEKAREARLKFFKKTVSKIGADKVALAHTKDDLVETVLMRILRGTGLKGLMAIEMCLKMEDGMTLFRPLLNLTKKELLGYLKSKRVAFRIDPTNRDFHFLRNRVRHKLLPLLRKDYNPQIDDSLISLHNTVAWDYIFIQDQTLKCFERICKVDRSGKKIELDIERYGAENRPLRRMVLRQVYKKLRGNTRQLTRAHVRAVEDALDKGGKSPAVTWPGGITIQRDRGRLVFQGKINP